MLVGGGFPGEGLLQDWRNAHRRGIPWGGVTWIGEMLAGVGHLGRIAWVARPV